MEVLTMLEECIQNLIWWPSTINSYIGMVVTWTIIFTNIYYIINFSSNCYSYFSPPADKHVIYYNYSQSVLAMAGIEFESRILNHLCKNVEF